MEDTKVCSRCKCKKELSLFNKGRGALGRHGHCRSCQKACKREWYEKNKENELKKASEYSRLDSTKEARKTRYREDNEYREKMLSKNRERRRLGPAKIKQRANERKRRLESPNYRIAQNLRGRLRVALIQQGVKNKSAKTFHLIGCSPSFLKEYLESLWLDGMTWENYGPQGWHIDHIKPCCSFNLELAEEQEKCFHYTNLQPLWADDNISKGGKILV